MVTGILVSTFGLIVFIIIGFLYFMSYNKPYNNHGKPHILNKVNKNKINMQEIEEPTLLLAKRLKEYDQWEHVEFYQVYYNNYRLTHLGSNFSIKISIEKSLEKVPYGNRITRRAVNYSGLEWMNKSEIAYIKPFIEECIKNVIKRQEDELNNQQLKQNKEERQRIKQILENNP